MAHRARIVHTTAALFWLAAGIVGVVVIVLAGPPWSDVGDTGAIGVVLGGTLGSLLNRLDRDAVPGGARLATVQQTRRAVVRQNALGLPFLAVAAALFAVFLSVWWVAAMGLALGAGELALLVRIARWERRRPDDVLAQELSWGRPRQFAWRTVWGDTAPGVPSAPHSPHLPNPALAAGRFWPSRDPEDYR